MTKGAAMTTNETDPLPTSLPSHVRIAIVGTGFAGIGMAIRLQQEGIDDVVLLERAGEVGGTWRDNRYPGCQCDVPSNLYSFSFAPNPDWSRTFAPAPEIWRYLRHCVERYDLRPKIRLHAELTGAAWDEALGLWQLQTARGALTAEVLVAGAGALHEPAVPRLPGIDSFAGEAFHSARWPEGLTVEGRRVAVVGTGASAIQIVPSIQPEVARLSLFQRTPPWVMPHPGRAVRPRERALFRRLPALQRLVRAAVYWGRETYVLPFMHPPLSRLPERVARQHLARQVPDPELRRALTPDYAIGCKRILISNAYYPALTQPNVEVVTAGIREVRPHAIVTDDGVEHEVDTIVYGTGFHVTDMPIGSLVRGRDGLALDDVWRGSPQAHRGTTVAGFPNLFLLVGPNTGLGHNSIVFMIESQVAYVLDCLRTLERCGAATAEPRRAAQAAFNAGLQRRMRRTVWTSGGCASWYLDATGRNTTLWPGSSWSFRTATRRFDPGEYDLHPRVESSVAAPAPALLG